MKEVYVDNRFFPELSVESINNGIESNGYKVPVYGDFSTALAAKLNEMFRKDSKGDPEDQIESLGRDFDGNSETFDYKLGRNDVITGVADKPATIMDTTLSIEHTGTTGIGMYNIINEVAGIIKGVPNSVVYTSNYNSLTDGEISLIKDLIVRGNKHIILILFVDEQTPLSEVKLRAGTLYDLMRDTNHLTVFVTYMLYK